MCFNFIYDIFDKQLYIVVHSTYLKYDCDIKLRRIITQINLKNITGFGLWMLIIDKVGTDKDNAENDYIQTFLSHS